MKFIDEKGRIFGKINVIDLSVVLIIIVSITTLYIAYENMHKKKEQYTEIINVKVLCQHVPINVANAVKIGDRDDAFGKIIDIKRVDVRPFVIPHELVKTYEEPEEFLGYGIFSKMFITFRVACLVKRRMIYTKGIVLKIGKSFVFSMPRYDIQGTIIGFEEVE